MSFSVSLQASRVGIVLFLLLCAKKFRLWERLSLLFKIVQRFRQMYHPCITENMLCENAAKKVQTESVLQLGVLGTSQLVTFASVWPCTKCRNVKVAAVASRSVEKAISFAKRHGISKVFNSYEELISSPTIQVLGNIS